METPSKSIMSLFDRYAANNPKKCREQLVHALHTARLAEQDGRNINLIAACLLHEIGHLLDTLPKLKRSAQLRPEKLAADWLSNYFPLDVCEPIRMQTAANRYLCFTDKIQIDDGYQSQKHEARIKQDNPMGSDEAEVFQQNPWFDDAISLCNYRKRAQQEAVKRIRSLNDYAQLLDNITSSMH